MRLWMTLLRREWWEHRGGFLWTPLAILALVLLGAGLTLSLASSNEAQLSYQIEEQAGADSASRAFEWRGNLLELLDFSQWSTPVFSRRAAQFRAFVAQPFILAHFLVAVFVLLGTLHEDRKDRSVLFWKSMPVSDAETVFSKLILAVWVAPLVTIAAILLAQIGTLLLLTTAGLAADASGIGHTWMHAGIPNGAVTLITGYLVQGLWALPVYAWLLLVSAAAPKVPFVWALLVPMGLSALESIALGSSALSSWIKAHLGFAALPRPESVDDGLVRPGVGLAEQISLLFSADMAIGLAAAAVLLAGAVRFRARNNDL